MAVTARNLYAIDASQEQARAIFEAEARRWLDMSAAEFAYEYDVGHWSDPDAEQFVNYVQSVRQFAGL